MSFSLFEVYDRIEDDVLWSGVLVDTEVPDTSKLESVEWFDLRMVLPDASVRLHVERTLVEVIEVVTLFLSSSR